MAGAKLAGGRSQRGSRREAILRHWSLTLGKWEPYERVGQRATRTELSVLLWKQTEEETRAKARRPVRGHLQCPASDAGGLDQRVVTGEKFSDTGYFFVKQRQ